MRYRNNDYSVPVAFSHQEVWIRGYVHEVIIGCGSEEIVRHPRFYDREDLIFNPIHYLPLLEKKVGALDQAAPLVGWDLRQVEDLLSERGIYICHETVRFWWNRFGPLFAAKI